MLFTLSACPKKYADKAQKPINAASVILVHNHPSGDPSPSEKDTQIVNKIAQAGEIMGIPVIDFIIV